MMDSKYKCFLSSLKESILPFVRTQLYLSPVLNLGQQVHQA